MGEVIVVLVAVVGAYILGREWQKEATEFEARQKARGMHDDDEDSPQKSRQD